MKRGLSIILSMIMLLSASVLLLPNSPTLEAATKEKYAADVNVAKGKKVTASSEETSDDGYTGNCVDLKLGGADNGRMFSTLQKSSQGSEWISIELEAEYNIKKVGIYFCDKGVGAPSKFKVEIWDGTAWKTLQEKSGYTTKGGWLYLESEGRMNGSKVRLYADTLTKVEGKYALQLMEITVWGYATGNYYQALAAPDMKNIAKGAAVNVSSSLENVGFYGVYANNLTDGKTGSFSSSTEYLKSGNTEWVEVLLDGVYRIDSVTLWPRMADKGSYCFPKDFTISIWNDGTWKTVVSENDYPSPMEAAQFTFGATEGSRIRVTATELTTENLGKYCLQLCELQATGSFVKELKKVDVPIREDEIVKPTTYNTEENFALNKPVSARTDWAIYQVPVESINDGVLGSFYSSDATKAAEGQEEWVIVDLMNNYSVDEVVLYERANGWGFPTDFTISVFYDGEWFEVVNKTGYKCAKADTITEHVFKFQGVIGNQVKLTATKWNPAGEKQENALQIMEMAVYGEEVTGDYILSGSYDLGKAATLTASSSLKDFGLYEELLVDGNEETGYSSERWSEENHEEWIEFAFVTDICMSEIQLKPSWSGYGFPVDFTISVWQKDKWVEVAKEIDYEQPVDQAWQSITFDTVKGSKIRITATKLGKCYGQYAMAFNEIKLFPYATDFQDGTGAITEITSVVSSPGKQLDDTKKENSPLLYVIAGTCILWAIIGGVLYYLLIAKKVKDAKDKTNKEKQ